MDTYKALELTASVVGSLLVMGLMFVGIYEHDAYYLALAILMQLATTNLVRREG